MSARAVSRLIAGGFVVVFAIHAWQLKWISDDGYIYLTYVQNWVENGVGPVFNRGEYVEAYTSVGWFGLLSLFDLVRIDRLLPLTAMTQLVSIACATAAVGAWFPIERRAAGVRDADDQGWRLSIPLAYVAGTPVFATFATSGLETSLLMLWLSGAVATVWRSAFPDRRSFLAQAALIGAGPLVRPDLVLPAALLGIVLAVRLWRRRREVERPGRVLGLGLAIAFAPGIITVAVRVAVYAQLLPNTYYVKVGSGFGFSQGWRYFIDTADPYRLWLLAVAATTVIGIDLYRARSGDEAAAAAVRRRGVLVLLSLVTTVAVMSEGGDFMHGRMMITPWWLFLGVFAGTGSELLGWLQSRLPAAGRRWAVVGSISVAGLLSVGQFRVESRQVSSGESTIDGIADERAAYAATDANLATFRGEASDDWSQEGRDAAALADRLHQEIGIAVGSIGRRSFYGQRDGGQVYVYDLLGLTRLDVGRMKMDPNADLRIGHNRAAPFSLIASNPRVDFYPVANAEYRDTFAIDVGTSSFVLINLDLIGPLAEAGIIEADEAERMNNYLRDLVSEPDPPPELVTLVAMRYHTPGETRERAIALSAERRWVEASWMAHFAGTLQQLQPTGCVDGVVECLRLAITRHRLDGPLYPGYWVQLGRPDEASAQR